MATAPPPVTQAPPVPHEASAAPSGLRRRLRDMPAWLVSAAFHLLVMVVLGLWTYEEVGGSTGETDLVVAQPEVTPVDLTETQFTAEALEEELLQEEMAFSAVDATNEPPDTPEVQEISEELTQPVELELEVGDIGISAAPSDELLRAVANLGGQNFAGRGDRRGSVLREGGSGASERAVALGLQWLANHQFDDGHWSLHAFHEAGQCNGQCSGAGTVQSDIAGTALGLLPFLGAGQTHTNDDARYREVVQRALDWLVAQQQPDGGFSTNMYAHGQATIAVCEAYGMSLDDALIEPAQKALDFIVAAQHEAGGWRYTPGQAGDTSVVGWQLMALKSGQMAGLDVPRETLQRAYAYLDSASAGPPQYPVGAQYAYTAGGGAGSTALTAEGLLCRMYLGWPREHPALVAGVGYLLNNLPSLQARNAYYWYYATQVMHHFEGPPWVQWNSRMRDLLIATQEQQGHEAGSWSPSEPTQDAWGEPGGRLYVTSLSVMTLEVYYRHLPLYRRTPVEGF